MHFKQLIRVVCLHNVVKLLFSLRCQFGSMKLNYLFSMEVTLDFAHLSNAKMVRVVKLSLMVTSFDPNYFNRNIDFILLSAKNA